MSEDSKKPGVAFWAIVVVIVALLYPASYGPAIALYSRDRLPDWAAWNFWSVYAPMGWMSTSSPQPIRRAFRWYQDRWTPDDWAFGIF